MSTPKTKIKSSLKLQIKSLARMGHYPWQIAKQLRIKEETVWQVAG